MQTCYRQPLFLMRRSHRIILFLITVIALATFAFGVLMLIGAHK
jgi:hypothetical protein